LDPPITVCDFLHNLCEQLILQRDFHHPETFPPQAQNSAPQSRKMEAARGESFYVVRYASVPTWKPWRDY
jgi:hypothetical protein